MERNPAYLRNAPFSIIREVVKNAHDFIRDPERDFTRRRKLVMETLILILLGMEGNPLSCEVPNYFGVRPDVASAPAFVQQRAKLLRPEMIVQIFCA